MTRDFRLVEGLKSGVLIGMDIIGPKGIMLDSQRRTGTIRQAGNARFPLGVSPLTSKPYKRTARCAERTVIQPHTVAPVAFDCGQALPTSRDLLFTPETTSDQRNFSINGGSLYACAITSENKHIYVRNDSNQPLIVHKYMVLGKIGEADIDGCYMLDAELHDPAADSPDRKALTIDRQPDKEREIFCGAMVYGIPEEI